MRGAGSRHSGELTMRVQDADSLLGKSALGLLGCALHEQEYGVVFHQLWQGGGSACSLRLATRQGQFPHLLDSRLHSIRVIQLHLHLGLEIIVAIIRHPPHTGTSTGDSRGALAASSCHSCPGSNSEHGGGSIGKLKQSKKSRVTVTLNFCCFLAQW